MSCQGGPVPCVSCTAFKRAIESTLTTSATSSSSSSSSSPAHAIDAASISSISTQAQSQQSLMPSTRCMGCPMKPEFKIEFETILGRQRVCFSRGNMRLEAIGNLLKIKFLMQTFCCTIKISLLIHSLPSL